MTKFKKGDRVRFVKFSDGLQWERRFGAAIGKEYVVENVYKARDGLSLWNLDKSYAFETFPECVELVAEQPPLLVNAREFGQLADARNPTPLLPVCVCPMHGPNGLLAVGCTCGAINKEVA